MAITTLRASGNNQYGQMTDVERANFSSQEKAADWILRKRLQDEAMARGEAQQDEALTAQERMNERTLASNERTGGTFAEREAGATARQERAMSPQLEALKFQREQAGLERQDAQPGKDYDNEIVRQRMDFLKGGGGFSDPKIAERARYRVIAGGDLPSDPVDEVLRQLIPALAAQGAQSGDLSQIPALLNALKTGDAANLPASFGPTPQAIGLEDVKSMAKDRALKFGERDAATFGFNPEQSDVDDLVQQRDDLAKAIKASQPRISDQDARSAANKYLDEELNKNANRWGTGWIKTARQALGLIPGGAP